MTKGEHKTKHLLVLGTQFEQHVSSAVLDETAGTLVEIERFDVGKSPDWLTAHPKLPGVFYAAIRPDDTGKVVALSVSPDGHITKLDEADAGALDPACMEMLPDFSGIVSAHFLGAAVSVVPVGPDGRFTARKAPHLFRPEYTPQKHPRQHQPHPHGVIIHNDEIIIPDQGCNRVWRLKYAHDIGFTLLGSIDDFEEMDGPRHGVVHPNGKVLYILNEISSTLSVHTLPPPNERSRLLARVSTYPPCDEENHLGIPMTAGVNVISGNRVICANRKSTNPEMDALAVVAFDPEDGSIGQPAFIWPGASHLRSLTASSDERLVVTGGRDNGEVVVFDSKWKELARMKYDMIARVIFI